jgi:bacterial/archaeal transporter family-2 protein
MNSILFVLLALLCGAVFPVQAGLNGKMTQLVGNPILTSLLSVFVGFVSILVYVISTRIPLHSVSAATAAPWYYWLAGMLGAFYVSSVIVIVPRLGFTLTFGLIITGQILVSLLFDYFGILDVPVKEISIRKIAGVALLILALVLIRDS